MYLNRSTILKLVLVILLTVFGAVVAVQFPTTSVGIVSISKVGLISLIGGLLFVVLIISYYLFGKAAESTRLVLFGVGIVLALTQGSPFNWVGVLAILLSIVMEWIINHRHQE